MTSLNRGVRFTPKSGHWNTVAMMHRSYCNPAALCLSGLSARSDDIPTLDVNPVCHGIAMQGELDAPMPLTSYLVLLAR